MRQKQSALGQAQTLRCDAMRVLLRLLRGFGAGSMEKSTRKEQALVNAFIIPYSPAKENEVALFLCFGCSSLLGRQLGSLAREARQGGHHFLGGLREPLVVIDTET
jgi:hypothetical protein